MDSHLLVIFLLASFWLYGAILLTLQDWRWNLGQVVLYCLCTLFGAWLVLGHHWDGQSSFAVILLFAATVLAPFFLRVHVRNLFLNGRLRSARWLQATLCMLTWRSPSVFRAAWAEAESARALGSIDAARRRAFGRLLAAVFGATSRRGFVAARIDVHVATSDYGAAVKLFDDHFGPGRLKPNATLLYTLVVAHSEMEDMTRAASALRQALALREPFNRYDMRRFMAMLRVYAMAGRVEEIEALFEEENELTALVPPAYPYLWGGVALMNAGETQAGIDALTEALARVRVGEERIREMIERRLWVPPGREGAVAESPEMREAMAEIKRSYNKLRASSPPLEHRRGMPVTWGLIIVCVFMWVLTEWLGSSTDARTLVRFGANVPSLVMHGEWWRLLSSVFLHVGALHLFFNAYACYLFGNFVERVSGQWAMFVVFMVSGIIGSATSALFGAYGVGSGAAGISAGASGAVFGVLGAATIITLRSPGVFRPGMRRLYIFNFVFIAAINMVFGLVETQIDNLAHGGGFAAGLLLGLFIVTRHSGDRRKRIFRAIGLLLAVLPIFVGIRVHQNVHSGDYSLCAIPLREHAINGRVRISVPVFWEMMAVGAGQVVFTDPWRETPGASLTVTEAEGEVTTHVSESEGLMVSEPVVRSIGGREYSETFILSTHGEPDRAHLLFQTEEAGRIYLLGFTCDPEKVQRFRRRVVDPVLEHLVIESESGE